MRLKAFALALLLPLCAPLAAHAERVLTLGIYLWSTDDSGPVKAQYLSIAAGTTETEIEGPGGYKSQSHPATPEETKLVEDAIEGRMKALSLTQPPQPKAPYVTVEWHVSHETGYAEGIAAYPLAEVPQTVEAVQKAVFGETYSGEK